MRCAPLFPWIPAIFLVGCTPGSTEPEASKSSTPTDSQAQAVRSVRSGAPLRIPGDTEYQTIYIGKTLWMASNLTFRNDTIDSLSWCPSDSCAKYGRLYSWRAAMRADSTINSACEVHLSSRGICPVGWHVPSKEEWNSMANAMGGLARLGTLLESRTGWDPPMEDTLEAPTDSVGFDALPAGYRFTGEQGHGTYGHTDPDSAYFDFGATAAFWSSTDALTGSCWSAWGLFLSKDAPSGSFYAVPRSSGLSVRCVKDSV